jgi:peroxiredoxin
MNVGDLAPDFELPADDGSTLRLSQRATFVIVQSLVPTRP